jgi:hypothetical protein
VILSADSDGVSPDAANLVVIQAEAESRFFDLFRTQAFAGETTQADQSLLNSPALGAAFYLIECAAVVVPGLS